LKSIPGFCPFNMKLQIKRIIIQNLIDMKKLLPHLFKVLLLLLVLLAFERVNAQKALTTCTWTGDVSTVYTDPGNWVGAIVPSSDGSDDVVIPCSCVQFPNIESVKCHDMIIESDKKSTLASPFGITGEFTVDGNFLIKSNASVIVYDEGWFTINGNLVIQGSMVMESGASLITNGSVTGIATVKRDVPTDLSWHLLSSPVINQNICNGVFAPTVVNFPGTNWDFYLWMPNCPTPPSPAERWRNLRTSGGGVNYTDFGSVPAFIPTKGYLVSYGTGFTTSKSFIGTPNTGDKVVSFADVITSCSWELAGNPFPSSVDWYLVTGKENLMSDYFYIWNEMKLGGAGYECYKDSTHNSSASINQFIHPEQGFFVKVDPNAGKALGLLNSSRAHDDDLWLKSTTVPVNKLTVKLSNGTNYDEAYIMFENNTTVGQDRNDAEKLFSLNGVVPQVYTIVNNDLKTCVNSMPFVTDGITIPVGFVAPADGNYSIEVKGFENFTSLSAISIEDLKLNITQNLMHNPVYNFSATGNEDAGRFLLHLAGTIGVSEKNNAPISIYSNENKVFITSAAGFHNAQVTISNLLGQEILTQKLNDQTINQVNVNTTRGYYIVKVQDESTVKTSKVYIN